MPKRQKRNYGQPRRIEVSQGEDVADMFSDKRKGIFAFISNKEDETKKSYLSHCLDYI